MKRIIKGAIIAISMLACLLIFVVGIPLTINECYKTGGYVTLWEARDVLAYYGAVISAVIGIAGVYLTVYIANRNYRDDARSRVLPFIAIGTINVKYSAPFEEGFEAESCSDNGSDQAVSDGISGKGQNHLYFVIDGKAKIRVPDSLSEKEARRLEETEVTWLRGKDGSLYLRDSDCLSMPFVIENIGNGAAKNLRMGLSYANNKPFFKTEIILKQNEKFYVHLFSEKVFDEIKGEYCFCIYYEDISGNQYEQRFPIKIFEEKNNKYKNMITNGKQRLIGRMK